MTAHNGMPRAQGLYDPAISWRSRRLAYTREPYDFDIWRMEIRRPGKEPGEPIRLISSARVDWQPQYSRDGKRIAFVSTRAGANEIWICEGDGSGWSPLARSSSLGPESKVVNPLDWSPDEIGRASCRERV